VSTLLTQMEIGSELYDYRNRRIGEFLKELNMTEGRGTGIPKILRAMTANGSPPPQFEANIPNSYND
jgi:ATP-dependent DNA helicase RecG